MCCWVLEVCCLVVLPRCWGVCVATRWIGGVGVDNKAMHRAPIDRQRVAEHTARLNGDI
jgi:hypothetical protein